MKPTHERHVHDENPPFDASAQWRERRSAYVCKRVFQSRRQRQRATQRHNRVIDGLLTATSLSVVAGGVASAYLTARVGIVLVVLFGLLIYLIVRRIMLPLPPLICEQCMWPQPVASAHCPRCGADQPIHGHTVKAQALLLTLHAMTVIGLGTLSFVLNRIIGWDFDGHGGMLVGMILISIVFIISLISLNGWKT
jgi:hypothetical protein